MIRFKRYWFLITALLIGAGALATNNSIFYNVLVKGVLTLSTPLTYGNGGTGLSSPGSAGNVLLSNGTSWTSSGISGASQLTNIGLSSSVGSNALTVALTQANGSSNCSSGSPCLVSFRSSTAATGAYSGVSVTSSLSITVPSGATLGQSSGVNSSIWVYLLNDSGTADICVVGGTILDEGSLQSSTQISSSSSGLALLYCASSHAGSNPVRLIGRLAVNESTAGTWASASTEIALAPFKGVFNTPGLVFAFAGSSCPFGSLAANATSLTQASFPNLFAVIGTTYGGSSPNFKLPDYRGVFLRGVGTNGSATYASGGSVSGPALGTLQNDQMQGHKQGINDPGHTHTLTGSSSYDGTAGGSGPVYQANLSTTTTSSSTTGITTTGASSDGTNGTPRTGSETRPFNMSVTYCIWY